MPGLKKTGFWRGLRISLFPPRDLPERPAWMHCGCELPQSGPLTHRLMQARELCSDAESRWHVDMALLLVRRRHHRRVLGEARSAPPEAG